MFVIQLLVLMYTKVGMLWYEIYTPVCTVRRVVGIMRREQLQESGGRDGIEPYRADGIEQWLEVAYAGVGGGTQV